MNFEELGKNAKKASYVLSQASTNLKNEALLRISENLVAYHKGIMEANAKDIQVAKENGMSESMLDRLYLDEKRITDIANGVKEVAMLDDPVGEVTHAWLRPNGLSITEKRVPLGVVGMIYEARPNVTADAAALCLKSGNAVILRGSKDAINSNMQMVAVMKLSLREVGLDEDCISLVEDTSREAATQFMKMNEYMDVLIPRGGKGLIQSAVQNATVPVIETGTGNCHVYVDESANLDNATKIIINAKTSRVSVCNACESILVHESLKDTYLKDLLNALHENKVEIRGDENCIALCPEFVVEANEEDWGSEYLDYIVSVKVVKDTDEAITHINKYNTGHSDCIVSDSYINIQKFLNAVDSACVYVNASTRFSDGNELGFGAEIGISTQKLHARGPMGLKALTTTKYLIEGNGQVR